MAKIKYGTMACEGQNCKSHDRQQQVVVFANEHGTLSYSCDWCGRSPYARTGTGQHDEWMECITPFDAAEDRHAKAAAESLPAAPAPIPAAARPNPARKSAGLLID